MHLINLNQTRPFKDVEKCLYHGMDELNGIQWIPFKTIEQTARKSMERQEDPRRSKKIQEAGNQSICIKSCAALPASKLRALATQMCHGEANRVWVWEIQVGIFHGAFSPAVQNAWALCIKQLAPTERTQVVQVSGPQLKRVTKWSAVIIAIRWDWVNKCMTFTWSAYQERQKLSELWESLAFWP